IPLDSKWRDALVLYAEVCSEQEASKIADYCWQEMQGASLTGGADERRYLRHVHCLRFLSDAFHSRSSAIAGFSTRLFAHIREMVAEHEGLLIKKIAIESAGLLQPQQIETVIRTTLSLRNSWLSENGFNACRYIARMSPWTELAISSFLAQLSMRDVWQRYS